MKKQTINVKGAENRGWSEPFYPVLMMMEEARLTLCIVVSKITQRIE